MRHLSKSKLASPLPASLYAALAAPCGLVFAGSAEAVAIVDFTAFGVGAPGAAATANVSDTQLLSFDVSATGEVTLDITTGSSGPRGDEIDGIIGTVSATGTAFSFDITLTAIGNNNDAGVNLFLTNGLGLGIAGNGTSTINWAAASPNSQTAVFEVDFSGVDSDLAFVLTSVTTGNVGVNGDPHVVGFDDASTLLPDPTTALAGPSFELSGASDSFSVQEATLVGGSAQNVFSLAGFAFDVVVIPEPGSLALAGCGLALLFARRR